MPLSHVEHNEIDKFVTILRLISAYHLLRHSQLRGSVIGTKPGIFDMVVLNKIEVSIEVDGEPLEEYKDDEEEDQPGSVTRYVEATTDAAFGIKVRLKRSFKFVTDAVWFDYELDGTSVDKCIVRREDFEPDNNGYTLISRGAMSMKDGFCRLRHFIFNEIKIGKQQ